MGFAKVSVGLVALRKAVNECDMTTEQWCDYLGIKKTVWYEILKGTKTPSEKVQRLLNAPLGLVNDWLEDDNQYMNWENLKAKGL